MFLKHSLITLLVFMLAACIPTSYRGVPQTKWGKLTAEQRQIIIDQSYDAEFNQ